MDGQIKLRDYLQNELAKRKQANTSYSMRAFAKSIGIHHGALSEFLNGKRTLSRNIAEKLLEKISDEPQCQEEVLDAFGANGLNRPKKSLQLHADHYHIVSDPIYYSILSLFETDLPESNASWVAGRLGITSSQAEKAIERLLRLGYLKSESGVFVLGQEELDTTYDVPSSALRLRQKNNLRDADKILDEISIELREFCAVTMAINKDNLPEAKKRIRKFRDELCEYLEEGKRSEVYELSIQLFPRSIINDKNN